MGQSWALLGRSWDALGRSWKALGRSWGALGALLGPLGDDWLAPSSFDSSDFSCSSFDSSILTPPKVDFGGSACLFEPPRERAKRIAGPSGHGFSTPYRRAFSNLGRSIGAADCIDRRSNDGGVDSTKRPLTPRQSNDGGVDRSGCLNILPSTSVHMCMYIYMYMYTCY